MIWLVSGLIVWTIAHLFKRVFPSVRETMGTRGRYLIGFVLTASLGAMIYGHMNMDAYDLYALPVWAWYVNNVLMFVAIFLFDAGKVKGVTRTMVRHPMLWAVVVWSLAHLLVNGDQASIVLFGGLGLWALLEIVVINRAEGTWTPPIRGSWSGDFKLAGVVVIIYAAIVGIHYGLDRAPLVWM